ncbi:MAG TPA: CvpA family protein [Candidatus Baltobacteraceae bacterium]|jgi:membrane protein required for colicin V production
MSLAWPDLVIGAIALIAALKGFRRGFVKELGGAVALFLAILTPWFYNGALDGAISGVTHLGPGSAHVIGMFLTGIATYAVLIAISIVLDKVARLPVLGIFNAIAGAAIGLAKAAIFCWVVLYVALFFPLSPDIRADLHRSSLAAAVTAPDPTIDGMLYSTLPWFAKPVAEPFFKRHRV